MVGNTVRLSGVAGEAGTTEVLQIAVPSKVTSVQIGDTTRAGAGKSGLVEIPVTFEGARFHHYQQIDTYRRDFTGGAVEATFRVPQRVFDQLAARRKAWPIPWTDEDRRSTWLAPERLLLFVQIRRAGRPVDRVAEDRRPSRWSSRRRTPRCAPNRRNFVGFYADVSRHRAGRGTSTQLEVAGGAEAGPVPGRLLRERRDRVH